MRKFTNMNEINTSNILNVADKCCYQICVDYDDEGNIGLQDAGCLEAFAKDAGIEFMKADDECYYYRLNKIDFKVPYFKIMDRYEDDIFDIYLMFDKVEVIK